MVWTTLTSATVGQKRTAAAENLVKGDLDVLGGPMTSFTSTWSSSGAQPSIGNGSITAGAVLGNKIIDFHIAVAFGTTTTFGTGSYGLTLPVAPISGMRFRFSGWIYQGTSHYAINGMANGTTDLALWVTTTAGAAETSVTPTSPATLTAAAGNGIYINGRYEAA